MTPRRDATATPPWWARTVFWMVLTCTTTAGVCLIFGPAKWTSSMSLRTLHHYVPVPWPAWGAVALLVAVLLCNTRTRFYGYTIAAVTSSFVVGIALYYTGLQGDSTNILSTCLSPLAPVLLFSGARYAREAERARRAAQ